MDIPLEKEHAPFDPLLFPLISIVEIQTHIAELVENRKNSRIKSSKDLQVLFVARRRGHGDVGWVYACIVGCAGGDGGLDVGCARGGWGAGGLDC